MRLACVLLVAACGHPRAPAVADGPPYRALFEAGGAWTLPIETTSGGKRGDAFVIEKTTHGTVHCAIDNVHRIGDATVSHLACAAPHNDLLAGGAWVAEPAGLYHPLVAPDDPDELAMLNDDDLLLEAAPKERQHSHALEDSQDSVEAFTFAGGWCVRDSVSAELDRRDYTVCFGRAGMTGGSDLVITGPDESWRRARFGKAPPDPDDPTLPHDD